MLGAPYMGICVAPLTVWRGPGGKPVFRKSEALNTASAAQGLACGQCRNCRVRRTREWATRIMCEVKTTEHPGRPCAHGCPSTAWCTHRMSIFGTFTFAPEFLGNGSLSKRPWQLFAKRARFELGPFRYFVAAEYGDQFGRPHFHPILFGQGFLEDRYVWRRQGRIEYFRSPTLERLWADPETGRPLGHVEFSEVTFASAQYVAGYTLKKLRKHAPEGEHREEPGPMGLGPYIRPHPKTGEPVEVEREFALMSRRPGIGAEWAERWGREAVADDEVRLGAGPDESKARAVPRFFRERFATDFPEWGEELAEDRRERAVRMHERALVEGLPGVSQVSEAWARADRAKRVDDAAAGRRRVR